MKASKLFVILIIFSCFKLFSQEKKIFPSTLIPVNLKENANSTIINQNIEVDIISISKMKIKNNTITTVYNEFGLRNIDANEHYSNTTKINKLEAILYDASGQEIKKFRKKDFKYQSSSDGYSILTDDMVLFLEFTPTLYPFTIQYSSEIETENTAFIPKWYPIKNYYESVMYSNFTINFPEELGFKYKEIGFNGFNIESKSIGNKAIFKLENTPALRPEEYGQSFEERIPHTIFSLEKFQLEGIQGTCKTWKDFGNWVNESLLKGLDELPEETVLKVRALTAKENDPINKAKIIYEYVQNRTRYVSIQLGIGGWKPMKAKDVDRLGYGDCKALSNYTHALLKAVDVPSYYTIIYAGNDKKDLSSDFVHMQGNHATLAIPHQNKYYFLECTSQDKPFGFEGDFTDDRLALVIKPNEAELIKTNSYDENENTQIISASYKIDNKGVLKGNVQIVSKAIRYENKYRIQKESPEKIKEYYAKYFNAIENLNVEKFDFENDRNNIAFKEKLEINATNYGQINQNKMIFPLNAFNQNLGLPHKYRNRLSDFIIERGTFDSDEIEIQIPDGYNVEFLPEQKKITEKFGEYNIEFNLVNNQIIKLKRTFLLRKGKYPKADYESFRKFIEHISRSDNSKIVLIQKT